MYRAAIYNQQRRGNRQILAFTYPEEADSEARAEAEAAAEDKARRKRIFIGDCHQAFDDAPRFIKRQREQRGLSRAQLAKKIAVSAILVARLESGTSRPSQETARKLAKVFRVKQMQVGYLTPVQAEAAGRG